MTSGNYDYIRDMVKERSGLVVTPDKTYLIETRLAPVARSHGFETIDEMVEDLLRQPNEALTVEVTEALNTHESLFFRDHAPFDLFEKKLLPELIKRRDTKRRIRVWCAACSSGQEPYSLAMIVDNMGQKLGGWSVDIVATDISHAVLKRAQDGLFSQFEVQRGLPVQYLVKYFTQDGEYWRVNQTIRDRVDFRPFNLLNPPRTLGTFDVVFCRNVLIYFDIETKTRVLSSIRGVLADDGVLFLGSAESTMGLSKELWPVEAGRGVYKHTQSPSSIAGD